MSRMVLGVTLNSFESARICPLLHILTVEVPGQGLPAENILITSASDRILRKRTHLESDEEFMDRLVNF